jgi:ATP-dependent Clp protease ATP-binding subunit ClpA
MSRSVIGFGDRSDDSRSKGTEAINRLFNPEFRNRLDGVIPFGHLTTEIMKRVVDKFIGELGKQLGQKKVELSLSSEALQWLAGKGYDPLYGARPLGRLIQTEISDALSEEILFGRLKAGGKVSISLENDRLTFEYSDR